MANEMIKQRLKRELDVSNNNTLKEDTIVKLFSNDLTPKEIKSMLKELEQEGVVELNEFDNHAYVRKIG